MSRIITKQFFIAALLSSYLLTFGIAPVAHLHVPIIGGGQIQLAPLSSTPHHIGSHDRTCVICLRLGGQIFFDLADHQLTIAPIETSQPLSFDQSVSSAIFPRTPQDRAPPFSHC